MLALLTLATVTLSGCSGSAEPGPTPTPAFASEEEAFAEAEEVYRAYIDEGNRDAQGSHRFLTGDALEDELEASRLLEQRKLQLTGGSTIIFFSGVQASVRSSVGTIEAQVCLDVSASRLIDSEKTDVTPIERADRWLLDVTFVGSDGSMLIASSTLSEDSPC